VGGGPGDALCSHLHTRHQLGITHKICYAVVRESRLSGAEQLARTTQFEVALRNDETIIGIAQDRKAIAREPAKRRLV
jgi:hypothetical protein